MGSRAKARNFSTHYQDQIDRLKGIALPEKIKCGRCNRNFNHAKFSTKQLMDARFQIKSHGRIVKNLNCIVCIGAPVVEIECIMCHKTQGLEEYSKVQRKDPSNAKCYKCVNDQVTLDAVNDEKYEDPLRAFTTPDHSGGRIPEYFTSSSTSTDDSFSTAGGYDDDSATNYGSRDDRNGGIALSKNFRQAMYISDDVDESLIETEYTFPPATDDGWSEIHPKSWRTNSAVPSSSGFNPNKYGNPRTNTGSVSGKSMYSFASSQAERSETVETSASGFAKIRAAPIITRDDTSSESEEEEEDDDSEQEDDDDDDDDTVI